MKNNQNIGRSDALVANRKSTTISVVQLLITAKLSFVDVSVLFDPLTYRDDDPVNLTSATCVQELKLPNASRTCQEGRINESHCTYIFPDRVIFAVVLPRPVIISCVYEVSRSQLFPISFNTRAVPSHVAPEEDHTSKAKYTSSLFLRSLASYHCLLIPCTCSNEGSFESI